MGWGEKGIFKINTAKLGSKVTEVSEDRSEP